MKIEDSHQRNSTKSNRSQRLKVKGLNLKLNLLLAWDKDAVASDEMSNHSSLEETIYLSPKQQKSKWDFTLQ